MRAASDSIGVVDQPTKTVRQLEPEPATMREAQASPEWPYWKSATKLEIDGYSNEALDVKTFEKHVKFLSNSP